MTLPHEELDSLIRQFESDAATHEQRRQVAAWGIRAAYMEGRPVAAAAALRRSLGADSIGADAAIVEYAMDDSAAAERLIRAVERGIKSQTHPDACNAALSRLRRGDSTGIAAILATVPTLDDRLPAADVVATIPRGIVGQATVCGQVLRGVLAARWTAGPPDDHLLFRADSIMRLTPVNYADFWNYDLALALAHRGAYGAAAAAARRRFFDLLPLPRLVIGLRHEGRWAALAGDTTAAISAYRHYLLWRQTPEPALIPERDSVRNELAALERRSP
jgi:hypothetical protein